MEMLVARAKIKPMFVQNRCYAAKGWDKEVRDFCGAHKIYYQGFSLLTANPQILRSAVVATLAKKYQTAAQQIIFRFSQQIGMIPLTGTSNAQHMKADLEVSAFTLLEEELMMIKSL
jgi:diketogulonate reductase-like aldo/keto reductase